MKRGIEFTFKNGKKDWYDPVEIPDGLQDNGEKYIIYVNCYDYEIDKNKVASYKLYDLCEKCGHELVDGLCPGCGGSKVTDRENLEWLVYLAIDTDNPIITIRRGRELLGFKYMDDMREWLKEYGTKKDLFLQEVQNEHGIKSVSRRNWNRRVFSYYYWFVRFAFCTRFEAR